MLKMICLLVFIGSSFLSHAQKSVPAVVKEAFQKSHPNSSPKWEKEGVNYEANFTEGGEKMSCVVDRNGNILETETSIASSQLPPAMQTYLKSHLAHAKVKETAKIVKANGDVIYEAEANKKDYLFDANGKFLKTAKD